MVRQQLAHYRSTHTADAQSAARVLEADEHAMLDGFRSLRYDVYARSDVAGKPAHYTELIPQRSLPYLYASRRMFVPFGWHANPLPSTCATSWAIFLAARFDPFRYGG
jgi:hypothetical protein